MVSPWTKKGTVKEEEDNIYDDDNNWPKKDLKTAAKGKERKGKVKVSQVLHCPPPQCLI